MLNAVKKIPQLYRYPRHARSLLEHSTPRKMRNLFQTEFERRMRRPIVKGFPYVVYVDPCNACNLSCPLCPGGVKKLSREIKMMKFETYGAILDQIKEYVYEVNLYNWGEAFLNPDIFRMIAYNKENNLGTNISSNLSLNTPGLARDIVDSGLEYLSVSLDGATADVYEKYRVSGDFELAVRNMADVVRRKNEAGAKKPFVEWQYIVTRHNEHQIDDAKAMGKELGVDLVRFIPVRLIVDYDEDEKKAMAEEWFPTNPAYRKFCFENFNGQASYLHKENCFHLYRSLAINPDGGVHPCNIIYHPGDDFGNILNSGFKEIWNNDQYRAARSLFNPDKVDNKVETPCSNCRIFRR